MIQYYIDELMSEGITYLPPFENSHGRPRTKSASEALVANPEQTEEDGNALPIASSAIEVADVETLGARSGKHIVSSGCPQSCYSGKEDNFVSYFFLL